MRLMDRLVLGTFMKLFVVSVLATPPLFILGDLTENIDRYMDSSGIGTLQVAEGYLWLVPQYVAWSFPVAALIAAVFTIHGMTTHREVMAAKAGGISFHRLIAPILLAGVVLTGAALALTELAPRAVAISNAILQNEDRDRDWRRDFVYQTESGMTLQARELAAYAHRMEGVLLERRPTAGQPALHVQAESAVWDSIQGWTLVEGNYRNIRAVGEVAAFSFDRMIVRDLTERPADLLETTPEEEEMTYREIDRLARIIERSGGEPHELRVKKEQKIALPVATLVIILFGAPLATSSKRGGAAYGIGIALGTTMLYLILLKVAGGFGSSGALPALWAAWLPNAVFFVGGVVLLARVRT